MSNGVIVGSGDLWEVWQADARALPVDDDSVDLVVTSPPYWAQRSYKDGGEHYEGQIGDEMSPLEYVEELVEIIDVEVRRVLKSSGSLWLNLDDKYAGSSGEIPTGFRTKSQIALPERVSIALIDRGWIRRSTVVWSKPSGVPESPTDRVWHMHEYWYHFTLEPRYYSAIDRIREPASSALPKKKRGHQGIMRHMPGSVEEPNDEERGEWGSNPLGRLPSSVKVVQTVPLVIPDEVKERLGLVQHYAAFPQEWPRWIVEGWSPEKVCTRCGVGYSPVTISEKVGGRVRKATSSDSMGMGRVASGNRAAGALAGYETIREIVSEACVCEGDAPTVPGVVLDPFGGTGTTAGVARTLGRRGISVDLSSDYCRLAVWRIEESGQFEESELKRKGVAPPKAGRRDAESARRLLEAADSSEWVGL